jgi:hypothetical protein
MDLQLCEGIKKIEAIAVDEMRYFTLLTEIRPEFTAFSSFHKGMREMIDRNSTRQIS